jgi:hypothetical protein
MNITTASRSPATRARLALLSAWTCTTVIGACLPGVASAQATSAMHWGAMDLLTSHNNCLGRARKAYYDIGARNVQNTGWQVYAEKGGANVVVSCSPLNGGKSYLLVLTASPDTKAAELLRNDIRTRIARMREY